MRSVFGAIVLGVLAATVRGLLKLDKKDGKWKVEMQDQVLVLTDDNFNDFVAQNKFVFVKFYAPWCGYCKQMAPEYSALAKEMHERPEPLPLTQVDCTVHKKVCSEQGIDGYPTLKFYVRGNQVEFDGRRTAHSIRKYIDKRIQPQVRTVSGEEPLGALKQHLASAMLLVASESADMLQDFQDASLILEDVTFLYSVDANLDRLRVDGKRLSKYNILAYRDEHSAVRLLSSETPIGFEEAIAFIKNAERQDVLAASEENVNEVFHRRLRTAFLFYNPTGDSVAQLFEVAASASPDAFRYIKVPTTDQMYAGLFDLMGHYPHEDHSLVIADFETGQIRKFKLPAPLDQEKIDGFFRKYQTGSLSPHFRSEKAPTEVAGTILTVVGDTFEDHVIKNRQAVFLKVYSHQCYYCRELAPIFEQLAEEFKDDSRVRFAEINGRANESPHLVVEYFPDLKLYIPGNPRSPVAYKGSRTAESLRKFLTDNLEARVGVEAGVDEDGRPKEESETL